MIPVLADQVRNTKTAAAERPNLKENKWGGRLPASNLYYKGGKAKWYYLTT